MRTQTTDDQDTLRFRAPTLEAAVALAEQSLGARVRVLAANRIRRGGIGGFFASDLGIEVIVTPDSETVEDALERLISDSAKEERFQWQADRGSPAAASDRAATDAAADAAADAGLDMPGRRWLLEQASALPASTAQAIQDALADGGSHAERRARRRPTVDIDPSDPSTNTSSWWEPPAADGPTDTPRRTAFDDIVARIDRDDLPEQAAGGIDMIDVLAALASSRNDEIRGDHSVDSLMYPSVESAVGPTPVRAAAQQASPQADVVESPGLIRVEKIIEELQALTASPRLLTVMKQRQAQEFANEAVVSRQALLGTPRQLPADAEHGTAGVVVARPTTNTEAAETVDVSIDLVAELDATSGHAQASDVHAGPSQRQVELAVAAADQLIDSLSREDGVKRLSVRIVLRTAGQDEVEAGAEWESKA
jgi:hypothetical protein